jgi:hypothetical protein
MAILELKQSELEDLYFEGLIEKGNTTYEVVEEGDWTHDHKHQSATFIFTDGERYFRGYAGRSGSEWTEWTYDSEMYGDETVKVYEVVKKEVTRYEWVAAKD